MANEPGIGRAGLAASALVDAAFDALPSSGAVLDAGGRIVAVNAAWRRFGEAMGLASESWGLGLDYLAVCDHAAVSGHEDVLAIGAGLRRILGGAREPFEAVYECHDTERKRWFRLRGVALGEGDRAGALVLHDDVTREHLARGDPRRQVDLLAIVHDAVISADCEGTIRTWNRAAEALYGYSEDEAVGRSVAMLYFPEDASFRNESLVPRVATEDRLHLETRTRHKSGREVLVDARLAAIRDGSGALIGIVGCSNDLTERSTAERQLAARNQELEAIFRAQPDLMFRLDADGTIVEFRAGRESDLYLPPERFLGKRMAEVVPAELGRRLGGWLDEIDRERAVVTHEYELEVAGGVKWFEARLVPFDDGGVLMWIRDVSGRHAALEHQRRLMDELDHRVKNALAAIAGIADETLGRATSLAGFAEAFRGRLHTMARAHETLARGRWEGADLSALAGSTLEPYLEAFRGRVSVAGSPLRIPGRWVTPLALVLHELAMNALRHGALARAGGTLHLSWRATEAAVLELEWRETSDLVGSPGPRGAGLALIEDFVALELDGRLELGFEGGLTCRITVPRSVPAEPVAEHPSDWEI